MLRVGPHPSILPSLLRLKGRNRAMHATDGQHLRPGTLYVAPAFATQRLSAAMASLCAA